MPEYELTGSLEVQLPASGIAAFLAAVEQAIAATGVSLVAVEFNLKLVVPPPTSTPAS